MLVFPKNYTTRRSLYSTFFISYYDPLWLISYILKKVGKIVNVCYFCGNFTKLSFVYMYVIEFDFSYSKISW